MPESPEKPELRAVLHSLDEHLRILGLVLEELREKLREALERRLLFDDEDAGR